ncbi:MAG: DUF4160 domain-containing protein [Methylococcales bacterium]|nr:DUF4160 domain-containing protein [Methylococcales bacterium]MDD5753747.1 DUF4160 domain-containing protein [Methylococcales bacterium]
MTTKQRFRNKYRLELRENDHEPMHVHFVGGDINAKIDLVTLKILAGYITPGTLRKEVLMWLEENQTEMIKEWKKCQQL